MESDLRDAAAPRVAARSNPASGSASAETASGAAAIGNGAGHEAGAGGGNGAGVASGFGTSAAALAPLGGGTPVASGAAEADLWPGPEDPRGRDPCMAARARLRAAHLGRYARARIQAPSLYLATALTAFLVALHFADPPSCLLVFAPALAAELAERRLLRGLLRRPAALRGRRGTARVVFAVGALNAAVAGLSLVVLWRLGGPEIAGLVQALALGLSAHAMLVHEPLPRLNLLRQAAFLAAFAAPPVGAVIAGWPDPPRAAEADLAAAAILAAIMAVVYACMHAGGLRRTRAHDRVRRARRQAERRSRALETVRDAAERAALHDALTGLPNRRYLDRRLAEIEAEAGPFPASEAGLFLLAIDLDRFKAINDALGHEAGDHVLTRMAELLRESLRGGDFAARIGGDEFVVAAFAERPEEVGRALAERIVEAARVPLVHRGQVCRFGATVGVACAPREGARPRRLLAEADLALYRAKRRGRGRVGVFSEDLQQEAEAARRLADDLLRGLESGELAPWYEPQFRAGDLALCGLSVSARWRHPTRGLLGPESFRAAAEETGAQPEIDRMILAAALEDRRDWLARGLTPPRLCVATGLERLCDPGLAAELAAARLPAGALAFELEAAACGPDEAEALRWAADRLAGLRMELDLCDFGAGPGAGAGALDALARLRPRRLRLSPGLTAEDGDSSERRDLIRALAGMARALDAEIGAAGIAAPERVAALAGLGVAVLQGPALGPAGPAAETAERLAAAETGLEAGPEPAPEIDSDPDPEAVSEAVSGRAGAAEAARGPGAPEMALTPAGAACIRAASQ